VLYSKRLLPIRHRRFLTKLGDLKVTMTSQINTNHLILLRNRISSVLIYV
jgi:hypothetical protein